MVIGSDQYEFIKIDIFAIGYLQQTSGRMRYNKEIKKIINNENTKAIYLVGSSKNVDLQSDNTSVNDIDLFVFTKNGDKQTRIVKYIENIEFDINYFSEKGVQKFINE